MMNRFQKAFSTADKVLNIYFTAGYPKIEDTRLILKELQDNGVDMVEIGMPFSDPLADGPTIQNSSGKALDNGMTISKLFEQLSDMRNEINIPVVLMGYINPILQYGVEKFCKSCKDVGVDGLILPDLPLNLYKKNYKSYFDRYGIKNVLLITPQTSNERIKLIDEESNSFVYMVSTASTTGKADSDISIAKEYFDKVESLKLKNPRLIGFNVKDRETYDFASSNSNGAIIGSAFVKAISEEGDLKQNIQEFIKGIR